MLLITSVKLQMDYFFYYYIYVFVCLWGSLTSHTIQDLLIHGSFFSSQACLLFHCFAHFSSLMLQRFVLLYIIFWLTFSALLLLLLSNYHIMFEEQSYKHYFLIVFLLKFCKYVAKDEALMQFKSSLHRHFVSIIEP